MIEDLLKEDDLAIWISVHSRICLELY